MGAQYNGRWLVTFDSAEGNRVGWIQLENVGTPNATGLIVSPPGGGMYPIPVIQLTDEGNLHMEYTGRWAANIPEVAKREREANLAASGQGERPPERPETKAVYSARLEGERLVGKMEWPNNPDRFQTLVWSATRAPDIDEHDDGTWIPGETVTLVDSRGAAENAFTIELPSKEDRWSIENGVLANDPPASNLESKEKFWNFDLHAEYRLFESSNSGIGLRGRYEAQIIEDYGKEPHKQGHGAIYYRIVPTSNPSKKPGEWQTMDVRLIGREVSVTLNGVNIIDKKIIEGLTAMATNADEANPGPITIQGDHQKVEFRNFTVTKLEKRGT